MTAKNLTRFAWGVVFYTLLVVAFGAFVRATYSGAGCGNHWPLCGGEIIPSLKSLEQKFEFSHRISSGFVLFLVAPLTLAIFRNSAKGEQVRRASMLALTMTCVEALVGMMLVKFGWVNRDDSLARVVVMSVHVISTFILIGSLAATAVLSSGAPRYRWKGQGALGFGVSLGFLALMFLGISGAISALGHTLRPVDDVLQASLDQSTFWMVRIQPFHPLIAVAVGLYLLLLGGLLIHLRPSPKVKSAVQWMVALYAGQMALGAFSILLRAPVWMQMLHLALADLCFVSLVACMVYSFGDGMRSEVETEEEIQEALQATSSNWRETVSAYIALTKPRVISLLLFTTLTAMFIAKGGWPGTLLILAVAIGGYCSAGAANAINMVIDRDIDATMKRTSKRPTVTHAISSRHALMFAGVLAVGSFVLLGVVANLLTAVMALSGLVFYVIVYTMLLKRRTWHNIVIGGAAGAFPPMVGYAAVTDYLSPLAWWLFAIIFAWTPVHFWALAILIKDDYEHAGVPMLPVVRGVRATVIQISLYTLLTALVSAMPLLQKSVGTIYFASLVLLNLGLVIRTLQLYKAPERPQAVTLYKYSMMYLALLFLMMAIDRSVMM